MPTLRHAAGVPVDRAEWHAAFGAALAELLIDRLSVYAMVHRVKPQSFLPRVSAPGRRSIPCSPPMASPADAFDRRNLLTYLSLLLAE